MSTTDPLLTPIAKRSAMALDRSNGVLPLSPATSWANDVTTDNVDSKKSEE